MKKLVCNKKVKNILPEFNVDELGNLVLRVTDCEEYKNKIHFSQIPYEKEWYDRYLISNVKDGILIEATSGTAAAAGFNYYLKEYCNSYVGPLTKNINLPKQPPKINGIIKNESVFLYRYFMNYCTFSYSQLFSDWEEYERLTDWMLLSGVNLFLNIVGHEIVWRDLLFDIGYTQKEVDDYLCGPAYLPWQWMGNMTKFGGNLPTWWYDNQKELGNKINEKLQKFGVGILMPGYFGMVPANFKEKFPKSNPIDQGWWVDSFKQPALLVNNDPMFNRIADLFYTYTKKHFGDIRYFSGDPFHEGGNTENINLVDYGVAIVNKMKEHTPDGIWFFQGWTQTPKIEMLDNLNKEDVLICSLAADKNYNHSDNFSGYPWIYSTTHNFGGDRILDGNALGFLQEPYKELEKEDNMLLGIGMTMEAITIDEIFYDMFSKNSISSFMMTKEEFSEQYVKSRYGNKYKELEEAVIMLIENVYKTSEDGTRFMGQESCLCARPSLDLKTVSTSSISTKVCYSPDILIKVLNIYYNFYDELCNNEGYKLDLMDIARQIIANLSWDYRDKFAKAYKEKDYDKFSVYSEKFLELFELQEHLMSTNKLTLLGNWIEKARKYSKSEKEKRQFEFNARNLLWLWGDKYKAADVLRDYAHKEWSGMIECYRTRWDAFISSLHIYFDSRDEMPEINWTEYDYMFALSTKNYPKEPYGDLKLAVEKIMEKI